MRAQRIPLATGLTYNVLEWDGPDDVTFVLVHGFSDLAFAWHEVAPLLAARGRVIAPDLRGHGDSDWVGAGGYYYYMDYVADLDDVIAQRACGRVILVGHSMGGGACSYWAGIRPERAAGLVLLEGIGPPDGTGLDGPERTAGWIDAWRSARTRRKPMASLDEAVRRLRKNDPKLGEDLARKIAEAGTRPVEGGFTWKQDPLHHTFGPLAYRVDTAMQYWRRVACPVIIADGADSTMNLPEAERARRRACFANHRHVVIADAGHMIPRHQPARTAELALALV